MCPNCRSDNVKYLESSTLKVIGVNIYKIRCKCSDCHYEYYSNFLLKREKIKRIREVLNNRVLTGYGLYKNLNKENEQNRYGCGTVFCTVYNDFCKWRMEKEEALTEKKRQELYEARRDMSVFSKIAYTALNIIFYGSAIAITKESIKDNDLLMVMKLIPIAVTFFFAWYFVKKISESFWLRGTHDMLEKKAALKAQRKRMKKINQTIGNIKMLRGVSAEEFCILSDMEQDE